ncbi:MAG: serine hydrolase [Pseudomonadota bacterium]
MSLFGDCAIRYLINCCLAVINALIAASTIAAGPSELNSILRKEALPGIVWSSVGDDESQAGASGLARVNSSLPMTATTKVQVGSVTKTLLALGVLQLITDDRLALDTNAETLLPELNWDNPWPNTPVTVQHLLEHTAGLDNLRMWQFLNSKVTGDTPLAAAFPTSSDDLLRIRTTPGSQYSYSNMGYALLGMIIERITGERYEDYLHRALLSPLGMYDSSFHFVTQDFDARLAMGYIDGGVEQSAVPMYLRSAGQFTTTAYDMQIVLRFLLGDGQFGGKTLVAPEYMQRLGTPSTTDAYRHGLKVGHGLALALRDRHGVLGECHPGTTFGFRAQLCIFRDQKKAFFYAVNADNEKSNYERLTKHFIEQLEITPPDGQLPTAREDLNRYAGLYKLSPPNMAQFDWLDWMFNSVWVEVDEEEGGLVIRSLQASDKHLQALGSGLFREEGRTEASHVMYENPSLAISNGLMTWSRGSPLTLGLAWTSLIAGMCGILYIFVRGSLLFVTGRARNHITTAIPWICLIAFALPIYLYTTQSFLQFGERTTASVLVAILTGALPVSLGVALYLVARGERSSKPDLYTLIAGFQLCAILMVVGVLPVMFWR